MVSNNWLFYVHLRFNEVFGTLNDKKFADISVKTVDAFFNFHQLG